MKDYLLPLKGDMYTLKGERYGTICAFAIQRIFHIQPRQLRITVSNSPFKGSVRVKRLLWYNESRLMRQLTCRLFKETILPWTCERLDKDFPQPVIYIKVWT